MCNQGPQMLVWSQNAAFIPADGISSRESDKVHRQARSRFKFLNSSIRFLRCLSQSCVFKQLPISMDTEIIHVPGGEVGDTGWQNEKLFCPSLQQGPTHMTPLSSSTQRSHLQSPCPDIVHNTAHTCLPQHSTGQRVPALGCTVRTSA